MNPTPVAGRGGSPGGSSTGGGGGARPGRTGSADAGLPGRGLRSLGGRRTATDTARRRLSTVDCVVIYRFIDAHKEDHSVATMARLLGVSRSGYYAWKTRPRSSRAQMDELLKKEISKVHAEHDGQYGAPRIHSALQKQGRRVSRKRVARLMRELGIVGLYGGPRRSRKR